MAKNEWIPRINEKYAEINTDSWFDLKITKNPLENDEYCDFVNNKIITRSKKNKIISFNKPSINIT